VAGTGRTVIDGWEVVEATVDELFGAVQAFLHEEEARAASLNSRGSGLTGFVGIILSIAAAVGTLGGNAASLRDLHHAVRVLVGVLLATALFLLILAIIFVVWKVLLPKEGYTVDLSEIERFPTFEYISRQRVQVQGDLMLGLVTALEADRRRNDDKATWLGRSYKTVCLGLILVALAGTSASLDRYVAGDGTTEPRPGSVE
jgi:hypothetical protein